jgi:hypothetical protein
MNDDQRIVVWTIVGLLVLFFVILGLYAWNLFGINQPPTSINNESQEQESEETQTTEMRFRECRVDSDCDEQCEAEGLDFGFCEEDKCRCVSGT